MSRDLFQTFSDTWILDGVRAPMVDCGGAFADANPIDLGIKVANGVFELDGGKPRGIRLAGKVSVADRDTRPRLSPPEMLAKLRPVFKDGVQTGGNSSALTDAVAAAVVASGAATRAGLTLDDMPASRSMRRKARRRWPCSASSGSSRPGSTPRAAPSRWATRWPPPACD